MMAWPDVNSRFLSTRVDSVGWADELLIREASGWIEGKKRGMKKKMEIIRVMRLEFLFGQIGVYKEEAKPPSAHLRFFLGQSQQGQLLCFGPLTSFQGSAFNLRRARETSKQPR
jgi:hypothetical protein